MNPYLTKIVSAEAADQAVEWLSHGEVVALPTETVYGLAADASRPEAVLKIFEAKERPFFDPLIVHLPEPGWLDQITRNRRRQDRLAAFARRGARPEARS